MLKYMVEQAGGIIPMCSSLNARAAQGWRLHTAVRDAGGDVLLIFEREEVARELAVGESAAGKLADNRRGRPRKV